MATRLLARNPFLWLRRENNVINFHTVHRREDDEKLIGVGAGTVQRLC